MGDIIEFTTWPKHQNIFYKITSGAIIFYVKGSRNAAVGLAKNLGQECDYWVLLGYNQHCSIQKDGRLCCNVLFPNILSEEKYRRFWISWFNGKLQLGKSNETTPILSQQLSTHNLQYVTFSVLDERQTIHWKFYLPPQIERPLLRKLNDGDPHWVKADKKLPNGALIGGHENGFLYIIRSQHSGSLTPGKFVLNLGLGYISWGGEMHEKNDYEVLCGYNCTWVKTKNSEIPVGAIVGGYSEVSHEIMYVGRAMCDGHLIPGKVAPSYNCCFVPYNGREVGYKTYEILIKPHNVLKSANKFYLSDLDIPNISEDEDQEEHHHSEYEDDDEHWNEDDVDDIHGYIL